MTDELKHKILNEISAISSNQYWIQNIKSKLKDIDAYDYIVPSELLNKQEWKELLEHKLNVQEEYLKQNIENLYKLIKEN